MDIDKGLLKKFVEGKCSDKERFIVLQWMKSAGHEREVEELLSGHWERMEEEFSKEKQPYLDKLFIAIESRIHSDRVHARPMSVMLKMAASFVGIMAIGAVIFLMADRDKIVRTGYGEIAHFYLPDSSEVLLNGNSTLTYESTWDEDEIREVALDGEGFFSVRHTKDNQKFIVKTSEMLSIEVLGTKFNVSKRKSGTKVSLSEGSIRLNIVKNEQSKGLPERLLMEPGELVTFKPSSSVYVKNMDNPELHSSWKENKLVLDYTPLRVILIYLQDTHGLNVQVADPKLLNLKSSGTMPTQNTDLLIRVIAETFNLKVRVEGKKITLYENPQN